MDSVQKIREQRLRKAQKKYKDEVNELRLELEGMPSKLQIQQTIGELIEAGKQLSVGNKKDDASACLGCDGFQKGVEYQMWIRLGPCDHLCCKEYGEASMESELCKICDEELGEFRFCKVEKAADDSSRTRLSVGGKSPRKSSWMEIVTNSQLHRDFGGKQVGNVYILMRVSDNSKFEPELNVELLLTYQVGMCNPFLCV